MTTLNRFDLRKVIERLFGDGGAADFRTSFLYNHFTDVFRECGDAFTLGSLITQLSMRHYEEDGSAIVEALIRHFGKDKVSREIEKVLGPPQSDSQPEIGPKILQFDKELREKQLARGEALKQMRNAHALVIGIGDYQHLRKLENTIHDAQDIAGILCDPAVCGYPAEQVRLLVDAQATKARIEDELKSLAQRTTAESTVFIYAACHGGWIEEGKYAGQYLLPVNTPSRVESGEHAYVEKALSDQELSDLIKSIPARKLLLVLDCCFAGGIAHLRGEGSAEHARDAREGLLPAMREEAINTLASSGNGRVILAAANAAQTAKELPSDRNGLFTKYLLEGMRGAGGSGLFVDVHELYRYVFRGVSGTRLQTPQTPTFKAHLESPDFFVAVRSVQYLK